MMKSTLIILLLVFVSVFPKSDSKSREKSLPELMKAYTANKNAKGLAEKIGTLHFTRKEYKKALPFLKQASAKDPGKAEIHRMVGAIYLSEPGAADKDSAASYFMKALEANPYLVEASVAMGKLMEDKGDYGEAGQFYDMAAEAKPKNAEFIYKAGQCNFKSGELPSAKQKLLKALKLDPKLADAHFMIGQILMTQNAPKDASKAFGKALSLKPGKPEYVKSAAEAFFLSGNATAAAPLYVRYLAKKSDDPDARAQLGRCRMKLRNSKAALQEFDQVWKGKPSLIEEDFDIARLYFDARRNAQAKRILMNVLRLHPENAEAQTMVGTLLESEKEYAGAAGHYAEAIKADKARTSLYRKIGDLRLKLDQEAEAIAAYEAYLAVHKDMEITKKLLATYKRLSRPDDVRRMLALITAADPKDVANLMALGDMDEDSGNGQAALPSYLKVLKAKPTHAGASLAAGRIYLERKNYKEAKRHLDRAFKSDPSSPRIALAQARLYRETKKPGDALRCYSKVLAAEPKNEAVLDTIIRICREMGRRKELENALLKKTALNPRAGEAYASLGALYLEKGKSGAADTAFHKALELMGECFDCYLSLARICRKDKRLPEAIAYYKKALFVDSKHFDAQYELGRAQLNNKDSASALETLERALLLNKDHAGVLEALSRLYIAFNNPAKALSMFQEIVKAKPKDAASRCALGRAYLEIRNYARAEQELKAAQKLDPGRAETHLALGILYQAQNAPDQALESFARAYQQNPKAEGAALHYAEALYQRKDHARALPVLLEQYSRDKQDIKILSALMDCHLSLGEPLKALAYVGRLEKIDPDRAGKDYTAARIYYQAGQKDRALAILEAGGPRNDNEYYAMLGALYREKKENAKAAEALKALFNRDKSNLAAGFELGGIYEAQSDDGLAVEVYKSLEVSHPQDVEVKKKLLSVSRKLTKAEEVPALLRDLIRLEPGNADHRYELAEWTAGKGQKTEALAGLAEALKTDPGHPRASFLFGRMLMDDKDYAAAEGYLKTAARALRSDPAVLFALGKLLALKNEPARALPFLEKAHGLDPQNTEGAALLAGIYLSLKKTDKLMRLYQELIRSDPANSAAHKGLGDLHFEQRRPKEAMAEYAAYLESNGKDTAVLNRQAGLLLESGDVTRAITTYQQSLRHVQEQADASYRLGLIFLERREDEASAQPLFLQTIALDPGNADACRKLGRLYLLDKDTITALKCYLTTLKVLPGDTGVLADLARLLLKQGGFEKSEPLILRALKANPKNLDLKLSMGRKYLEFQRYQEAEPLLYEAYAARPNDVNVMTDLIAAYNRLGEPDKAAPLLDRLIKSGAATPEIRMQLGIASYGRKEFKKAREVLEKVLTEVDGTPEALVTLGLLYAQEKDLRKAKITLKKAIELDPESAPAHFALGKIMYDEMNYAEAQALFSSAMAREPDNDEPAYFSIMCKVRQKQAEGAMAEAMQALMKFKRSERIYFALAQACVLAGQYDKGQKSLELAVKINPQYKEAFKLSGDISLEFSRDTAAAVDSYKRFLSAGGRLESIPENLQYRMLR